VSVDRLLTLSEVADHLACSLSTVKRLVRAGDLSTVRLRKRAPRVRESDLASYVLSLNAGATGGRARGSTPLAGVVLADGERLTD
jgi:excisionase family DNA binding protein